jgi:hypothetical protein
LWWCRAAVGTIFQHVHVDFVAATTTMAATTKEQRSRAGSLAPFYTDIHAHAQNKMVKKKKNKPRLSFLSYHAKKYSFSDQDMRHDAKSSTRNNDRERDRHTHTHK